MAARACVALVAVVALAWLGVMLRDARLLDRGVKTSGRLVEAGDAARAEDAFRGARLLNPDTAPDLARVVLYQGRGRYEPAIALVSDVLRREPDNLAAWALLFGLSPDDPAARRRALAARRRLDPLNARPRPGP